ncbi:MAG TPA: hypothetical protein PLU73_11470 [Bacteroidia bacterium]|nr:hypothetical protein [Bacteroidia bacterium]
MEAATQLQFQINDRLYYLILVSTSIVFYTKAYISDRSGYPSNERDVWYKENKALIKVSQIVLSSIIILITTRMILVHSEQIKQLSILSLFLIILFPLLAVMYYGFNSKINLRTIGWLKPFIIGFCWAGIVTIYPLIFYSVETKTIFELSQISVWLFLKNFLFISVLCIMFDIKDENTDSENKLGTFVVKKGLQFTIFNIVLPLSLIGLTGFILFAYNHQFSLMKIILNSIPFLLMILLAYKLRMKRNLMYYLVYVDGLMLLKGICGIVAMKFF